jgi:hypothetical protein
MPKYEAGTAGFASQQMRKNQKSKIRWYCGLCHVPCKDENGFKCHLNSETHILREQAVSESLRAFKLSQNDIDFRAKFVACLVAKHLGQVVLAHEVYRELYPLDRPQNIMKATCWETLGTFIAQLKKDGFVEAYKGIKGWQIRLTADREPEVSHDLDDERNKQELELSPKRKRSANEMRGAKSKTLADDVRCEPFPTSTGRTSENKVQFSITKSVKMTTKAASRNRIPEGFAVDVSDDNQNSGS